MKDKLNKTLLFGLGALVLTKEKMEELVADLVKKGEVSQDQGKKLISEIGEKAEEGGKRINELLQSRVEEVLERLGTPRKRDLERLERKIQVLEEKIRELERE